MSREFPGAFSRAALRAACGLSLAMAMATGCASQEFLGENPARVRVSISGQAESAPIPETAHSKSPVKWDWGFYLVEPGGKLRKLRELNGQRTTVLEANPLEAEGEFLVPAGRHKARLLVEAYQYYSIGRLPTPQSLIFYQRDFQLDLGPGQTGRIKALVGGAPSQ
jgi:hypothetical protein